MARAKKLRRSAAMSRPSAAKTSIFSASLWLVISSLWSCSTSPSQFLKLTDAIENDPLVS